MPVVCLLLCSVCSISSAQHKVVLMHRAAKGAATRNEFDIEFTMVGAGRAVKMESTAVQYDTVFAVSPSGDITSKDYTKPLSSSINGVKQSVDSRPSKLATTVIRSDGTLVSSSDIADAATARSLANCMYSVVSLVFVNNPVGVGDSWTVNAKPASIAGVVPATVTYKVLASGIKQGETCFEIQSSFREVSGEKPFSATSTVWVSEKTGDSLSTELIIDRYPMPNADKGSAAMRMHISRIPAGPRTKAK